MVRLTIFAFGLTTPTGNWGWLSFALIAMVIAIPYGFSGRLRVRAFTWHYWLAPAAALLSIWHAWLPMKAGHIPRSAFNGLWLATVALGVLLVQLAIGLALRYSRGRSSRYLLQTHLVCMLAIVGLILAHVYLNSRLLRAFF